MEFVDIGEKVAMVPLEIENWVAAEGLIQADHVFARLAGVGWGGLALDAFFGWRLMGR